MAREKTKLPAASPNSIKSSGHSRATRAAWMPFLRFTVSMICRDTARIPRGTSATMNRSPTAPSTRPRADCHTSLITPGKFFKAAPRSRQRPGVISATFSGDRLIDAIVFSFYPDLGFDLHSRPIQLAGLLAVFGVNKNRQSFHDSCSPNFPLAYRAGFSDESIVLRLGQSMLLCICASSAPYGRVAVACRNEARDVQAFADGAAAAR